MNRQIRLAAHPDGMVRDSDFEHVVAPVPEPDEGEALVRNLYLSIDPAIRGWMNGADTYVPGIHAGDVMRSAGIGEVVESRNPRYNPGDRVLGFVGWQDWSIVDSEERSVEVIPPVDPATAFLSVYGVTGVTAYFGTDVFDAGGTPTAIPPPSSGTTGTPATGPHPTLPATGNQIPGVALIAAAMALGTVSVGRRHQRSRATR